MLHHFLPLQTNKIMGHFKMQITRTCSTALASLCLLSLGVFQPSSGLKLKPPSNSGPSARVQNYQSSSSSTPTQAVRQLFNQYKSLDLANNTQIMNLYANDATIDVLGTRYNKTSYGRFIDSSYHNPASGLNSHTVYGEPNIRATNDAAQVSFSGSLGPSSMYVYWNLRRNSSGVWQIASEQFTRAGMPVSTRPSTTGSAYGSNMSPASSPVSSINAGNQQLMDSINQMNNNPDMKAFTEHMRQLREQQKH